MFISHTLKMFTPWTVPCDYHLTKTNKKKQESVHLLNTSTYTSFNWVHGPCNGGLPVPAVDTMFPFKSSLEKKLMLCKAVHLLELFSLIVNMSRGNLLCDCIGTAIHNCLSSGSLFFATFRWNN